MKIIIVNFSHIIFISSSLSHPIRYYPMLNNSDRHHLLIYYTFLSSLASSSFPNFWLSITTRWRWGWWWYDNGSPDMIVSERNRCVSFHTYFIFTVNLIPTFMIRLNFPTWSSSHTNTITRNLCYKWLCVEKFCREILLHRITRFHQTSSSHRSQFPFLPFNLV